MTAGAVRHLLDELWCLVPGLDESPLVESGAGLRPVTPDGAPVLDTTGDGIHLATGHSRNGILLAPVTADAVADAVCGEGWPVEATPFRLGRFGDRR